MKTRHPFQGLLDCKVNRNGNEDKSLKAWCCWGRRRPWKCVYSGRFLRLGWRNWNAYTHSCYWRKKVISSNKHLPCMGSVRGTNITSPRYVSDYNHKSQATVVGRVVRNRFLGWDSTQRPIEEEL